MIKTAIIIIGDEILLGRVADTNSSYIAREMDRFGSKTEVIMTVGDNGTQIKNAVTKALDSADIVFTTGGLGPTKDDITKQVLAEIFGGGLVRDASVTKNIEKIFAHRSLKLNALTLDQALVPSTAFIIQNVYGTAPVMVFRKASKTLISLPGVPYEMEGMLPAVLGHLKTIYLEQHVARHSTFLLTGISESALAECLCDFENGLPATFKLAYLPDSPVIRLRIDCYDEKSDFEKYEKQLEILLKETENVTLLGKGEKTLPELVLEKLKERGLTLSTAESCTGGNIARWITSVPGSSEVFNGSAVAYANSAKINILGVGSETLKMNGAVSRQVVVQMAEGAANIFSTDCAIATSGIAGPGGGSDEKPVGTVWIAVKTPNSMYSECKHFRGHRDHIVRLATSNALISLLKNL